MLNFLRRFFENRNYFKQVRIERFAFIMYAFIGKRLLIMIILGGGAAQSVRAPS